MKQKNHYSKKHFYFAISLALAWSLLVWKIIDYKAMLAVITTIVVIALIVIVAHYIRKYYIGELDNHDNDEVKKLQYQIQSLNKELRDAQIYRTTLESKISYLEHECTLDCKYSKTLVFFQRIDDMFRNLDTNITSPNFEQNVRIAIDEVFYAYGYRFIDYSEQTCEMYDCEYQPVDRPEVIFRAIVSTNGRIATKGKVFLPIN